MMIFVIGFCAFIVKVDTVNLHNGMNEWSVLYSAPQVLLYAALQVFASILCAPYLNIQL